MSKTALKNKLGYEDGLQTLTFTGVHVGKSEIFLAYLTTLNQSFTSTWNTEAVYGRVDPIATFQGNQRSFQISWEVPSHNDVDATSNMKRFKNLAQLIYPSYTAPKFGNTEESINALTLAKPPLMRIKYANLLTSDGSKGLLGYISNLSWAPVLEMGWFTSGGSVLLPKVVSLNVDFTVLHEQDLGWGDNKKFGSVDFPYTGV